jgi:hypothetical protein
MHSLPYTRFFSREVKSWNFPSLEKNPYVALNFFCRKNYVFFNQRGHYLNRWLCASMSRRDVIEIDKSRLLGGWPVEI